MAAEGLQAVALTAGDLRWILAGLLGGATMVSSAIWWLAHQFKLQRDELAAVKLELATARAEAKGTAINNDTRANHHSDRIIQLDTRVHELEQWRLRHVEDHR